MLQDIIETPELPPLKGLKDIIDRLNSVSEDEEIKKRIERHCKSQSPHRNSNKESRFVKHLEDFRREYLRLMEPEINREIGSVIDCLSDFYGLKRNFRKTPFDVSFEGKPFEVRLVDFVGLGQDSVVAQFDAMDGGSGYPTTNSYFQKPGYWFFPPHISLNIREGLPVEDIVEESLHFLQWFYGADEETHAMKLTTRRFLGTTEIKGSPIIKVNLGDWDFGDYFSDRISKEAMARFTRVKSGLTIPRTAYEDSKDDMEQTIPGIPEQKSQLELLDALTEQGRLDCYRKLLDWNGVEELKGIGEKLSEENILSYRFMDFPQGLIHHLGYGLGERLAACVKTQRDVAYLGRTHFRPGNPEEKLDELVNVYKALS